MDPCEIHSLFFFFLNLLICKISVREFRNTNSQYPKRERESSHWLSSLPITFGIKQADYMKEKKKEEAEGLAELGGRLASLCPSQSRLGQGALQPCADSANRSFQRESSHA